MEESGAAAGPLQLPLDTPSKLQKMSGMHQLLERVQSVNIPESLIKVLVLGFSCSFGARLTCSASLNARPADDAPQRDHG